MPTSATLQQCEPAQALPSDMFFKLSDSILDSTVLQCTCTLMSGVSSHDYSILQQAQPRSGLDQLCRSADWVQSAAPHICSLLTARMIVDCQMQHSHNGNMTCSSMPWNCQHNEHLTINMLERLHAAAPIPAGAAVDCRDSCGCDELTSIVRSHTTTCHDCAARSQLLCMCHQRCYLLGALQLVPYTKSYMYCHSN